MACLSEIPINGFHPVQVDLELHFPEHTEPGLEVVRTRVAVHSNCTLLSLKNKNLALSIAQCSLSPTHTDECWWSASVHSLCMSDPAAARDNNPAGNHHPALLDCCGGLNNVDYSKVKLNQFTTKPLCVSSFHMNRCNCSDKRRRIRFGPADPGFFMAELLTAGKQLVQSPFSK